MNFVLGGKSTKWRKDWIKKKKRGEGKGEEGVSEENGTRQGWTFQIEAVLCIMVAASNHDQIIMINGIDQPVGFIDAA